MNRFNTVAAAAVLIATPVLAQEEIDCPHPADWRPAEGQLAEILRDHEAWLWDRNPAVAGRAILCNADLSEADLTGANLQHADLRSANLIQYSQSIV